MKKTLTILVFIMLVLTVCPNSFAAGMPADATVKVYANEVLEKNFIGVGVQWSSYPWWDISEDDWNKLFSRLEFMKMPFARVMIDAFWYCKGFDSNGQPIYLWNTSYMQKLYKLMDWCQANDVVVMFGEWGRPEGVDLSLQSEDPRWSRIVADCMEHMLYKKGYTCIKYYNLINEPHGPWMNITWDQWKTAIDNLYKEFDKRGLLKKLMIAAPDGSRMWTTKVLLDEQLNKQTGIYDEHWYLKNDEILKGNVERYTREQIRQIKKYAPGKQFFLGEVGILDGKNKNDQQVNVYKFWYGVSMADAAIQMIRGGMAGFKAWNLDDAMHYNGDGGESMNSLSDKLPDNAYEMRKIWGFWNIIGAEHGDPDDENMRPLFYPWSLLSRNFPPGCQTLEVDPTGHYRLNVAAARIPAGFGKYHFSFAVANNADRKKTVKILVPKAAGKVTLSQYDYFDQNKDEKVDAWPEVIDKNGKDIFPSVTRTLRNVDLASGFIVTLPSKGAVILTTIEEGSPISLKLF